MKALSSTVLVFRNTNKEKFLYDGVIPWNNLALYSNALAIRIRKIK